MTPEIVHHYCPIEAFDSITRNRILWFSSALYMNDPSELELVIKQLKGIQRQKGLVKELAPAIEVLNADRLNALICSFSENGDILGQWRAYGADGKGYSIGFDAQAIHELLNQRFGELVYKLPVKYGDNRLESYVESELQDLLEGQIPPQDFAFAMRLSNVLHKHACYAEERELRFMLLNVKEEGQESKLPIDYRFSKNRLIPFYPFDFPSEFKGRPLMAQVTIGPTNLTDPEVLKTYLAKLGFTGVEVKKSELPYRGR